MDELLFEPDTHEYRHRGMVVPSVTQLLAPLVDFSGIPPENVEYARLRGEAVHFACELYDQNDLDMDTLDPKIVPYLQAWIKFKAETGFVVHTVEERIPHPIHRYAGMIDRTGFMAMNNVQAVLDIKCVAKLSPVTGLQTAAYKELVERDKGITGLARYSVRLGGDGKYELKRYEEPDDFRVFLSLLNLHNWRKKYEAGR
jgi:hypothetical protein